jgi:hypothetical protein
VEANLNSHFLVTRVATNQCDRDLVAQFGVFLTQAFGVENRFVLSHENFLRPSNFPHIEEQMAHFAAVFDLHILITLRPIVDLLLSRYRQDLVITHRLRLASLYEGVPVNGSMTREEYKALRTNPDVLYDLDAAVLPEFECTYPYCGLPNTQQCSCMRAHMVKVINPEFYKYTALISRLRQRIGDSRVSGVFFLDECRRGKTSAIERLLELPEKTISTTLNRLDAAIKNEGRAQDGGLFDPQVAAARPAAARLSRTEFAAEEAFYARTAAALAG